VGERQIKGAKTEQIGMKKQARKAGRQAVAVDASAGCGKFAYTSTLITTIPPHPPIRCRKRPKLNATLQASICELRLLNYSYSFIIKKYNISSYIVISTCKREAIMQ
jgi:hypothetical protein